MDELALVLARLDTEIPHAGVRLALFQALWPRVAGETLARNSRVARLSGKRLHIEVADSTWATELSKLQPVVLAELNGQHVRLAKLEGAFVWHAHEDEDELFYVVRGSMRIEFRDGIACS